MSEEPLWMEPMPGERVCQRKSLFLFYVGLQKVKIVSSNKWSAKGNKRVVKGAARGDCIRKMSIQLETNRCPAPATCPLNQVRAGIPLRIKQLCAADEIAGRLREIGFCEQQMIKLLTAGTNIICLVCNARLAISPQLAQTILVEPVDQQTAA